MCEKKHGRLLANNAPTYAKDIVGNIRQWNQRDSVFARADLWRLFGENTSQFESYYQAHPKHLEYDKKISKLAGLGKTGGADTPMFTTQFEMLAQLGHEDIVDGDPAPQLTEIPPVRAADKIKTFTRFLDTDLVKIGPLRQEWTYSHVARSRGDIEGFQP